MIAVPRVETKSIWVLLLVLIAASPLRAHAGSIPHVVINEIHYHPDPSSVPMGVDPEFLQYLEFVNADTDTVQIGNWSISDGVEFLFPPNVELLPGQFVVVAKNTIELQIHGPAIPPGVPIFDWITGNLSNGGERVALSNDLSEVVDEVTYSDAGTWPDGADGNGPSLELINPGMPNEFGVSWAPSNDPTGTPGAPNSRFGPAFPALIGASHNPPIPTSLDDLTVSVAVYSDNIDKVTLFHRLDAVPTQTYQPVPMLESGTPGVYEAVLPPLSDLNRVDFYISATDLDGDSAIVPPLHNVPDPLGKPSQTFLCKFWDEPLPTDLPTYHLLITEKNRRDQETGAPEKTEYDATFIDDAGNIFYNVRQRYRGSSSLNQLPRSYRVDFDETQPLDSELGFDIASLNLMAQNPYRQRVGYHLFSVAGNWRIPTPVTQFVRLKVNPTNNQGELNQHVYINIERVNGGFLDSQNGAISPARFPDDSSGNLYRGRNSATLDYLGEDPDDYRTNEIGRDGYQKVTNETEDDWTDLIELCRALDENQTPDPVFKSTLEAIADTQQWARWFALHTVLANREGGLYRDTGDDYLIYFQREGAPGGRDTTLLPWDMDSVLGGFQDGDFQFDETIWRTGDNAQNTPKGPTRFLRSNDFGPLFVGAIKELIDTDFSPAVLDPMIDSIPESVADEQTKQDMKDFIINRRDFITGAISTELTWDRGAIPEPYIDPDPIVTITGALDQTRAYGVRVNGELVDHSVFDAVWSTTDTLHVWVNDYVIEALDEEGGVLDTIIGRITWVPPTVALPDDGTPTHADSPTVTRLLGAQPNPFRSQTLIRYDLSQTGPVRLRVFDVQGRLKQSLIDGVQGPGRYAIPWRGLGAGIRLPAGTYFYELEAPDTRERQKLLILR